ncbi:hypothetical protein [Pedobacter endophyticus]|uniref:Uncharacterized protein n=1 Tax=Pedobacter endophyticus TaxID=2789740 RepID=A0A7S9PYU5_9SPHI|nr:hypothetical protein [Pedobacter endophyticus]QPH39728.1 hypothetical protein IZT61_00135 [Pedobacter endophyticus]
MDYIIKLRIDTYNEVFVPFMAKYKIDFPAEIGNEKASIRINSDHDLNRLKYNLFAEIDSFEEILSALHAREFNLNSGLELTNENT